MKNTKVISLLFVIAALYDILLGLVFLFAGSYIFEYLKITPPNHMGYVQFPAALLVIFAILFTVIAVNPIKNKNLIPYGILLKISYCSIAFFHWLTNDIPYIWKPFAVVDLLFLLAFAVSLQILRKTQK